jgi:hypothetical protein
VVGEYEKGAGEKPEMSEVGEWARVSVGSSSEGGGADRASDLLFARVPDSPPPASDTSPTRSRVRFETLLFFGGDLQDKRDEMVLSDDDLTRKVCEKGFSLEETCLSLVRQCAELNSKRAQKVCFDFHFYPALSIRSRLLTFLTSPACNKPTLLLMYTPGKKGCHYRLRFGLAPRPNCQGGDVLREGRVCECDSAWPRDGAHCLVFGEPSFLVGSRVFL